MSAFRGVREENETAQRKREGCPHCLAEGLVRVCHRGSVEDCGKHESRDSYRRRSEG